MAKVIRLVDETGVRFSGTPLSHFVVYIVRCGDFVKVGTTQDLAARLSALHRSNPHPISLVATLEGDSRLERELHKRFAAHRHHHEWFRLEGAVADYIAELVKSAEQEDG